MRSLWIGVLLVAGLVWPQVVEACQSATPPPTLTRSEPYTRLHNSLLTDSPSKWWEHNKALVMSKLYEDKMLPVREEVSAIPMKVFDKIELDEVCFEFQTAGDYRQYVSYCREALLQLKTQEMSAPSGCVYDLRSEVAVLEKMADNIDHYLSAYEDERQLSNAKLGFVRCLDNSVRNAEKPVYLAAWEDMRKMALKRLAIERHILNKVYTIYPEKVIVDALFCLVYLNPQTLEKLPEYTSDFSNTDLLRADIREAREVAERILREAGPAALPYIRRAIAEYQGLVYQPVKASAFARDLTCTGQEQLTKYLPDQREKGGVLYPVVAVKMVGRHEQPTIDLSLQEIELDRQLMPMFIDFIVVFDKRYNTPFFKNKGVLEVLQDIQDEILEKHDGDQK